MGRDEHDARWVQGLAALCQRVGDLQAVQARHVDVQESHVRTQRNDLPQGFDTICDLGHDVQVGPGHLKMFAQDLAQQRLVIGDQGSRHGSFGNQSADGA